MTLSACPRCGTSVAVGARYCSLCGGDVSGEQASLATEQIAVEPPKLSGSEAAQLEQQEHLREATLGEYDIYGELGRGGMATVYLAHDLALDRKVAIKVMSPSLVHGEGMVERFKREARTAASLSHPNIIPVYAVRESERLLFFVMKFVAGRPLDSIMKEVGALPIAMIQTILQQVGNAFGYAHRRGIVHRDIKPANIMIDDEGWAVVTDFGIAKVSESQGLTMTGMTVGTPTYMSPEQCMAQEVTGASDQYSLGVVAYEMIAGRPPFTGASMMAIMYGHFNDPPPPITRPDCPESLRLAVMHMLEKDPPSRFPTVEEAVEGMGSGSLGKDDPTRSQLVTLAKAGSNTKFLESLRTPSSPVPRSRPRTGAPLAATSAARTAAAQTRLVRPQGAPAPAPAKSRMPLILGSLVAVLAVAALLVLQPWKPKPAPAESVAPSDPSVTVTAPPAATQNPVTLPAPDTAPPAQVARVDTQASLPASPPRPSAAQLAQAKRDQADYSRMRTQADDARARALAAGATPAELAGGDALRGQAGTFSGRKNFEDALKPISDATAAFSAALVAAQNRAAALAAQQHPPTAPAPRETIPTNPAPTTVAPTTPPVQTAPPPPADERPAVEQAIREYARAMESGEVGQVQRVYPAMPSDMAKGLGVFFKSGGTMKTEWTVADINVTGMSATAVVAGKNLVTQKGKKPESQPVNWHAVLERASGGWRIVSIK